MPERIYGEPFHDRENPTLPELVDREGREGAVDEPLYGYSGPIDPLTGWPPERADYEDL